MHKFNYLFLAAEVSGVSIRDEAHGTIKKLTPTSCKFVGVILCMGDLSSTALFVLLAAAAGTRLVRTDFCSRLFLRHTFKMFK